MVKIRACVDRMEKNLTSVDERYRNVLERLVKVEESLANAQKRVDEIKKELEDLDKEKVEKWIKNGAKPTDTVKALIEKA